MPPPRLRAGCAAGQATVELVALLPVLVLVVAVLWQAALAGWAAWSAGSAARASARAVALGGDGEAAARRLLPEAMRRDLRVERRGDGGVRLAVRVPRVPGAPALPRVRVSARFAPQR